MSLPEQSQSDVIIWPETAIPALLDEVRPFVAALAGAAQQAGVDYVTGIPTGSWETSIFHNSIIGVGRSPGLYHKRRLLPFGEYLPLRGLLLFFRDWVDIPMADFTPGGPEQPLFRAGGQPVGLSICFEAVFGSEIRRALPESDLADQPEQRRLVQGFRRPAPAFADRPAARPGGRAVPGPRHSTPAFPSSLTNRGGLRRAAHSFRPRSFAAKSSPCVALTPYARFGDWPAVAIMTGLLILGLFLGRRTRPTTA